MKNIVKKYIESGLSCLPVKDNKSPDISAWRNIAIPYDKFSSFGVGVKCGKESNGLECLDFDNHFGDAKQTLSEFIKQIKELYDKYLFPIQSTQSGGYHLLYRCDLIGGNRKLASKPKLDNNRWRPDAIIETRGEGGYFVIDPTPGYKFQRNDIFNIPRISIDERNEIINICKSFNEWSKPIKSDFEQTEKPGDYYNNQPDAKGDMINVLRNSGWKQISTYTWQRPDKKNGISATLGKVADSIFYNFSSNGHPFEPEKGYTPFQVVSLLKFKGNFGECAKWIVEKFKLKTVNDYHRSKPEPKAVEQTISDLDNTLNDCFVDIEVIVDKPPVILQINHSEHNLPEWERILTLGNFSAITGKSKSKKTFLLKTIIATLGNNTIDEAQKFKSNLPENKKAILHFDTEQSSYDVWKTATDIHTIGGQMPNVATFKLRDKKPNERIRLIERAVEKFKDNIGVLIIDGIADLVHSINSESESNDILYKFMKWTENYNIHIMCILHQNKGNDYATGWLGTQILKKSELVMAVEKVKENPIFSRVYCDVIRGAKEFPEFVFFIDKNGYPRISNNIESNIF